MQDASYAPNPLNVLIVENDAATARLTKEAFREVGWLGKVHSFPDGDDAMAYLHRSGEFSDNQLPDLIFLDLHLPKKDGFEVLRELKSNRELKVIPVVVVSGHENPAEIREAYELHASCYVRKPSDLYQLLQFIRACREFWGAIVTLPERET